MARLYSGELLGRKPVTENNYSGLIAKSLWLRSIDPGFARAALHAARLVSLSKGNLIYERGDPPGGLFGIVEGFVAASMENAGTSVVTGHVFRRGDWFGEIPTVTGGDRTIDTMALRDCELLTVPLQDMRNICDCEPRGWRWLAVLTAINSGVASRIARDLLIADPRQRVVSVIRRLIDTEQLPFDLALTQGELAEICALSRGVISRILGALEAEGAVQPGYGSVTFLAHSLWSTGR